MTMTPEEKEQIAQEKYGKSYDQLSTNEQKAVGGQHRANEMGREGYQEMSKTEYASGEERRQAQQERSNQ